MGCGVLATRARADGGRGRGDPAHPANRGKLCVKGTALGETVGPRRPPAASAGARRARYAGTRAIADASPAAFRDCIGKHGPDSVAFYVSGQLLTEDYYVANKLMKGYVGSANIDTNSRLCMSSAVAGHKRAFGEDVVPVCYDDLDHADLIVLVGLEHRVVPSRSCCSACWRRANKRPVVKIVVIDPRRTATCELADLHLPLAAWHRRPALQWPAVLAGGTRSDRRGLRRRRIPPAWTTPCRRAAGGVDLAAIARACGLDVARCASFYDLFARHRPVVTAFSQGVNQSSAGTDKVNSIINCHLLPAASASRAWGRSR